MRIEPLLFKDFHAGTPLAASAPRRSSSSHKRKDEPPPPPPPPTFNEEELKTAERESYKKGFLEGTEEGRRQAESEQAEVDRLLTGTVKSFAQSVMPLLADYRKMALQLHQDMPKVALAIAKKVAGSALEHNAQAAIEDMAQRCVELMIAEPKLTVRMHPSLCAALDKRLQALAARLQSAASIVVAPDDTLAPADCRIEWKHGAMERHTGQLWQEIEKAVESMVASAPRATQTQIEPVENEITNTAQDT